MPKYRKPRLWQNVIFSRFFNLEVLAQFLLQLKKNTLKFSLGPFVRYPDLLFFQFHHFLFFHSTLLHMVSTLQSMQNNIILCYTIRVWILVTNWLQYHFRKEIILMNDDVQPHLEIHNFFQLISRVGSCNIQLPWEK